ncbi:MAG: hypothetical protein M1819_004684 [Sarea resinae]|nr:MAG: hypothetical protein M1819_004684 [Sarea resinae]
MSDIPYEPVIIIGGGGCGLSLSSFLSNYGVQHILFERHAGTSILPKAHYLNQRTMETYRTHNMVDEIVEKGAPLKNMSKVAWKTSLGGDGPLDRKVIHKLTSFGGDENSPKAEAYRRDSAIRSGNIPLLRLEPILKKIAEQRNPGKILFSHTVTDLVEEEDSVLVTVEDAEGKKTTYRTAYVVGADGGRTVGPKIGVEMEGPTGVADMVSTHFTADLSEYWDDRYLVCHFINGSGKTVLESGAIVQMGPTWGRKSEEWTVHFGFDLNDEERFAEDKLVPRIKKLLNIPDLDMKVHKISHWILERVVASKYQQGRFFVAGDAAHRRPPTTGLGLNTAIEDALNLSWKLALVTKGIASPKLMDTYEPERRPIGKRNSDWGLFTFHNTSVINAAVGLIPGQTEANKARFDALAEDSEAGRSFRAAVARVCDTQDIEWSAHDIELGFRYDDGVLVHDNSEPPEQDPLGQVYYPVTRPGHRLPHAWLNTVEKDLSTHDIIGPNDTFALITDEEGDQWIKVAKEIAKKRGISIATAQIGETRVQYRDRDDQWEKVKGLKSGGAILVRPDNFVAWRSIKRSRKDGAELADAISTLLDGSVPGVTSGHSNGVTNGSNGTNGTH